MPAKKNQHYVPQSYFRLFSNDGKRICLYNLKRRSLLEVSIKHQCSKNYFYSKNTVVEDSFSQLERLSQKTLRKIITQKNLSDLSSDELNHLKSYILFQYGRTKSSGDSVTELANDLFGCLKPDILKDAKSKGKSITKEGLDSCKIVYEKPVGIPLIVSMLSGILIYDLFPVLLVNHSKTDFIFSDNPVILFNSFFNDTVKEGTIGFSSTGLQIFYPINSGLLLFLFDPNYYLIKVKRGLTLKVSKNKDVQRINGLQIINADENVYFQNPKMFNTVKQRHMELEKNIPAKKTEFVKVATNPTKEGGYKELYRTSRTKYQYNLEKLSFLKHNPSVSNKMGIRNEKLARIHSKVVDAVLSKKISSMDKLSQFLSELEKKGEFN